MSSPEEYNAKSMEKYGWSRECVDLPPDATMTDVTEAVVEFQKEHDLDPDGLVGPMTWRRIQAANELRLHEKYPDAKGFVLVGGKPIPVDFPAKMCSPSSAYSLIGLGGHSTRSPDKQPTQVVWHWDVAVSAASCHRILKRRKLSTHGAIDNDGTFVQFLDFALHVGWHAGTRLVNKRSIGIDLSNAVYTKFNLYYKRGWGPRPVIKATVHGREHTLLGYYDAQLRTAGRVAALVNDLFDIPLVSPDTTTIIENPEDYAGHIAHYHITKRKWDVAGFPFKDVLEGKYNE